MVEIDATLEIRELIAQRKLRQLQRQLADWEPFYVARLIEDLPLQESIIVFRLLSQKLALSAFKNLTPRKQQQLVEAFTVRQHHLLNLLENLPPDDRTALLEEMPGEVAQRFIDILPPEQRKTASMLLGYPEDSIGRLMTSDFVAVLPTNTLLETLEQIRAYGKNSQTLDVIYVVDEKQRLLDDLYARELLLASPEQRIADIMDYRYIALQATHDQEEAVRIFRNHDRIALPVTDTQGVLLGVVTIDDVLDVAEEEATEDFQRFGSVQDAVFNPLKAKVGFLYRKRILWLFALVFMNIFSGAAMAGFEETIQAMVSLVFFLPLLIDSGGNAGSQSATLMIRALATGDVVMKDWFKLLGKELLVALLLGVTMAAAVSAVASFRAPEIIVVVAMTMVCIVLVGSLVGMSLPFIFTKFGADPATASAPLITSIADISGVLIYFSIATWYLGI